MNPREKDPLLRATLEQGDLESFRRTSLEQMLSANAREQNRRQTLRKGGYTAVLALLLLGLFYPSFKGPRPSTQVVRNDRPAESVSPATAGLAVKNLTDEELFALFPNRATALVGPPGRQEFVFLDEKAGEQSEMAKER